MRRVADPQPVVFVLSAPRSGSTLLRVMLGSHPQLFSPPEMSLLLFDHFGASPQPADGVPAAFQAAHLRLRREGVEKALAELLDSESEAYESCAHWEREALETVRVYERLRRLAHPRALVDKSPAYTRSRAILDRAESVLERPKYVFLSRHPLAVIESFVRAGLHSIMSPAEHEPWRLAEEVWRVCNQNVLEFIGGIGRSRWHHVAYEQLVADPRTVARGLCEFLELPFSAHMLDPYRYGPMLGGPGDGNFLSHRAIDPRLAATSRLAKQPPLRSSTLRLAERLDYHLADLAGTLAHVDPVSLPKGW